jgi:hypothetical protein
MEANDLPEIVGAIKQIWQPALHDTIDVSAMQTPLLTAKRAMKQ